MRKKSILLVLVFSAVLWGQSQLAPNAPEDHPVSFAGNEQHQKLQKAIEPFIAQAKKSWPMAKAAYLKGLPTKHTFFITTELVDMGGKREIVFVEVQKIDKGVITGLIVNDISVVQGYRVGQQYSFLSPRSGIGPFPSPMVQKMEI